MEYIRKRGLLGLLHLLERLDKRDEPTPAELAELEAVEELYAQHYVGRLPNSMKKLKNLKSLSLVDSNLCDLQPLAELHSLKSLDLQWTNAPDFIPLATLHNLQSLNLKGRSISDLMPIAALHNLRFLVLSNTQIKDIKPLSELHNLQSLDLMNSHIRNIKPLARLQNLRFLDLRNTQVSDLTSISGLHNMQDLYIARTSIRDLTPLKELPHLRSLDLRGLNLQAIPHALFELNLRFVFDDSYYGGRYIQLTNTTISTQPISLFQQDREIIRAYYNAEQVAVREAKVIFLGDGGAGKTHTIKRILNKDTDENLDTRTTLGINISPYQAKGERGGFRINFWDFGGQENMHAMHRCFLTERTCYVVVISNRWNLDTQARYWLENIRSFAPNAPVILAVNKWEGISTCPMDTNRLYRDYLNLKDVTTYTAKGGDTVDFHTNLTKVIVRHAEKLDSNAMQLPRDWAAIRQELVNLADSNKWYIDQDAYYKICADHGLGGEEDAAIRTWLLDWFNDLGICFSHHEDQSAYNVLNPRWLTSAIYILLNSGKDYSSNGIMPYSSIKTLLGSPSWNTLRISDARDDIPDYILTQNGFDPDTGAPVLRPLKYEENEWKHILAIMRKFELSYPLLDGSEFIPALCNSAMPDDLYPTEYLTQISYEFRYSFLPDSLIQRLMVRLYPHWQYTALWRKGFRFEETNLTAVVDAGRPDNILRIDIFSRKTNVGKDTVMELVAQLRDLQQIMGMTSEEFIIVHGPRGEIPVPADIVLLAWEQNIPQLHLYSKENGLIAESPAMILGEAYSPEILDKAKQLVQKQSCTAPEAASQVVHNHYYGNVHHGDHIEGDKIEGDQYNHNVPENLVTVLKKLIDENYQTNQDFIDHLLAQLEASDEQVSREIARDAKADPKKKQNILGTLRKTASSVVGAASFLADSPEAIKTLTAIATAVSTAATQYGPEIAEFLSKFPILPI